MRIKCIEIYRVIMGIISLDISIGDNIENVVKGRDNFVQISINLDTSVTGLRGTIGIHLVGREG